MCIKAIQICIIYCIIQANFLAESANEGTLSREEQVDFKLADEKCSFVYKSMSVISEYSLMGNITNNKFNAKHGQCPNVTDKVKFLKENVFGGLEKVELWTPLYVNELPKMPNLKELHWNMHKCHEINAILRAFPLLESLTINYLANEAFNLCEHFYEVEYSPIKQLHINLKIPGSEYSLFIVNSLLQGLEDLELLEFNIGLNYLTNIYIPPRVLHNFENLTELVIKNGNIIALNANHFANSLNLKTLRLKDVSIDGLDFLYSEVLKHNLEHLEVTNLMYNSSRQIDEQIIKTLQEYKKLEIIQISEECSLNRLLHSSNLTAFICTDAAETCKFITDVNKRFCPDECYCNLHPKEMRFTIDCRTGNSLEEIPELPIPIVGNTSLNFSNQNLTVLPTETLYGYSQVRELHLANNQLSHLNVTHLPINLTYLDLSGNQFKTLDKSVLEFFSNRSQSLQLKLAGNPWICDCANQHLIDFVSNNNRIQDLHSLNCNGSRTAKMSKIFNINLCKSPYSFIYAIIAFNVVIIGIICIIVLRRNYIFQRLTEKYPNLRPYLLTENYNLRHDAFVAFSHLNSDLIEEYVEQLEKGDMKYKLCFYQRDWLIGATITQCIVQSIEDSRRTIILLTKEFAASSWCKYEFQSAISATSNSNRQRLIVILYPDVDASDLNPEYALYLRRQLYLERNDPDFWKKLKKAMPPKQREREQQETQA